MHTDLSLRNSIHALLLEADAPNGRIEDFDIQAIAEEIHQATGSWDLASIETDDFWEVVRRHDKTQQPPAAVVEWLNRHEITISVRVKMTCPVCPAETYVLHNGHDQALFELEWAGAWKRHGEYRTCAAGEMPMPKAPKLSATAKHNEVVPQDPYNGHCRTCYSFKGRTSGECVDSACACHPIPPAPTGPGRWVWCTDHMQWEQEAGSDC